MIEEKHIKVLFTSVGRRVELLQAFRKAAKKLNAKLLIYGADYVEDAPALYYCDYRKKVCRIQENAYIPELLQICRCEKIDLIIPTIDTDLLILAREKKQFEQLGTRVLISTADKIEICRDKRKTAKFFKECGLLCPETVESWNEYRGGFPCFIKPKNGSSSINAFKVDSFEELKFYAKRIFDYIIQPFIEGKEYTVDIFCDFNSIPKFITPRERITVRSGEVMKTRILNDKIMEMECRTLIEHFQPIGPVTVQLIRENKSGRDYFIEINPRFGGGVPLSIKAGADSPQLLLGLLQEKDCGNLLGKAREGALYCRFDQSVELFQRGTKPEIKAVVFDLDDTLYPEKAYIKSGFQRVCREIAELRGCEDELWSALENGEAPIDSVLKKQGCYTEELKARSLTVYRNHQPVLTLYPEAEALLRELRMRGIKLGVITDGRPEGQRAKIAALELEQFVDEVLITDELGGVRFRKPNDIPYRIMKEKLEVEYSEMLYVGDNPSKDFLGPKELGMRWIYFHNPDGLYGSGEEAFGENQVESIAEVLEAIPLIHGGGISGRGLIIVGAGGHGRVIGEMAQLLNRYAQIAFLDDNRTGWRVGIKIIGKVDEWPQWVGENDVFVAIGNPSVRRRFMSELERVGVPLATLIHPSAIISNNVRIGSGTVIMANAVVNSGCQIGNGVIINTSAVIEHENKIGDYAHIAVGCHLGGDVIIGEETWIGIGASVRNGLNIAEKSIVGSGAAVVKNIVEQGIYVGVPARRMKV